MNVKSCGGVRIRDRNTGLETVGGIDEDRLLALLG